MGDLNAEIENLETETCYIFFVVCQSNLSRDLKLNSGTFLLAWGIWCYIAAAKGLRSQWDFGGMPKHFSSEFASKFINIFMGTLSILFGVYSIYNGFK